MDVNKMMRFCFIFCAFIVGLAAPAEYYASKFDNLDVDTILNNRRMVNYYAACFLGRGPCTPQGLEIKRILPDALQTNCVRCTDKQKSITYHSLRRLQKEYPKVWQQLAAQWDPDGVYVKKFETTFQNSQSFNPVVLLSNRFGDNEDDSTNAIISENAFSPSNTNTPKPIPIRTSAKPASSAPAASPPLRTNSPTTPVPPRQTTPSFVTNTNFITNPSRILPPLKKIGANLEATVTYMKAIKDVVIKLYRHKLDTINRMLSGRLH